jgi:hypothetical protein
MTLHRIPIRTAKQLDDLDEKEVVEGYCDGLNGEREPGNNRSFSYWHGWRNGRTDRGGKPDDAQVELAHDVVRSGYNLTPKTLYPILGEQT